VKGIHSPPLIPKILAASLSASQCRWMRSSVIVPVLPSGVVIRKSPEREDASAWRRGALKESSQKTRVQRARNPDLFMEAPIGVSGRLRPPTKVVKVHSHWERVSRPKDQALKHAGCLYPGTATKKCGRIWRAQPVSGGDRKVRSDSGLSPGGVGAIPPMLSRATARQCSSWATLFMWGRFRWDEPSHQRSKTIQTVGLPLQLLGLRPAAAQQMRKPGQI